MGAGAVQQRCGGTLSHALWKQFCTFLARNRYHFQAACRTTAVVWVQIGDTQLYVRLRECKHRLYYASPVRTESAERGDNRPGNDLNCLIGSVFMLLGEGKLLNVRTSLIHHASIWKDYLYLPLLFSPFSSSLLCDKYPGMTTAWEELREL